MDLGIILLSVAIVIGGMLALASALMTFTFIGWWTFSTLVKLAQKDFK